MRELNFYYLDLKYIRTLSSVDDNVMSISPQRGKQNRPFLGVVILVNGASYCIPLTSPKEKFVGKKSQVDFIKIFDCTSRENGLQKMIGVLNINNMIPVTDKVIKEVDLRDHKGDIIAIKRHKELMRKQLTWCRKNVKVIENRANKVYDLVVNHPDKNRNLVRRSSDFKKLESLLSNYH